MAARAVASRESPRSGLPGCASDSASCRARRRARSGLGLVLSHPYPDGAPGDDDRRERERAAAVDGRVVGGHGGVAPAREELRDEREADGVLRGLRRRKAHAQRQQLAEAVHLPRRRRARRSAGRRPGSGTSVASALAMRLQCSPTRRPRILERRAPACGPLPPTSKHRRDMLRTPLPTGSMATQLMWR